MTKNATFKYEVNVDRFYNYENYYHNNILTDIPISLENGISLREAVPPFNATQLVINKTIDLNKLKFRYYTETEYKLIFTNDIIKLNDTYSYILQNNEKKKLKKVYVSGKPNRADAKGGITVVSYYDKELTTLNSPYGVLFVGIAICNKEDLYNFNIGRRIALNRLLYQYTEQHAYPIFGQFVINGLQFPKEYFNPHPIQNFNRILEVYLNSFVHELSLYVHTFIM
jgi:hypothetical protein